VDTRALSSLNGTLTDRERQVAGWTVRQTANADKQITDQRTDIKKAGKTDRWSVSADNQMGGRQTDRRMDGDTHTHIPQPAHPLHAGFHVDRDDRQMNGRTDRHLPLTCPSRMPGSTLTAMISASRSYWTLLHCSHSCVWYCWNIPGPSCRVTIFCLQLHCRVPGAGLITFLSRVTWCQRQGKAANPLARSGLAARQDASLKRVGYGWSYLACRIGHCVPLW
jgi:hypothetical protein